MFSIYKKITIIGKYSPNSKVGVGDNIILVREITLSKKEGEN